MPVLDTPNADIQLWKKRERGKKKKKKEIERKREREEKEREKNPDASKTLKIDSDHLPNGKMKMICFE